MPVTSSRTTLIEVAKLAGTSKTSVSRFFGPERERLTPKLQTRIAEAANTLGYQPNLMARGLKGGGSRLLGMLVADIRNPFSVAVVHGVEQAARASGYSLIVCNTDNDPKQEQQHLRLLSAYQVEGLIINASGQPEAQLQAIMRSGVPLVLLDRDIHQLDAAVIGLDNALAIDMALEHLVEQGYRSILYASESPDYASARQERLQRFTQQTATLGINGQTLILNNAVDHTQTLNAFARRSASAPGAVLCANGSVTLAMTRSFQKLGIAIGPTGLMGIDELAWCELITPGITTLAQPTDDIGQAAVSCLLNQLNGLAQTSPTRYRHIPRLQVRGSTTQNTFKQENNAMPHAPTSSPQILTFGEAMAMLVADLPGDLVDVDRFHRRLAGADNNVAIGLSRLGFHVGWLSRLGSDSQGRFIQQALKAEGIDDRYIHLDAHHPTGLMFKERAEGGADPRVEYFRRGSAASHLSVEDAAAIDFQSLTHLHATGITPALSESALELTRHVMQKARESGASISFDPNLRPSLWPSEAVMRDTLNELASLADWVLPGLSEGRLLTGCDTPEAIADFYLARGAKAVIIKLGPEGSYYRGTLGGTLESLLAPGQPVAKVVDTVGAGDGFAVGVISALLDGRTPQQALDRGNLVGAQAIQVVGDMEGLPTRDKLRELEQ